MAGYLSEIESLTSEDLATATLGYLISLPEMPAFRHLFFAHLGLRPTDLGECLVETQVDLGDFGRADMLLEFNDGTVLVENKFFASLSSPDQIFRYFRYLTGLTETKDRHLVLLTISVRSGHYLNEIKSSFQRHMDIVALPTNDDLARYMAANGVHFHLVTWESILQGFACGNSIAEALNEYVTAKFLRSTILTNKEISLMNTAEVPVLLEKLWATVDGVKDALAGAGYKVQRTSQAKAFYGFPIACGWCDPWFGIYTTAWKDYETPFVLMLRRSWIHEESISIESLNPILNELGFIDNTSLEKVLPLRARTDDLIPSLMTNVQKALVELDRNLSPLNSGGQNCPR
jgi:hypothetical protein